MQIDNVKLFRWLKVRRLVGTVALMITLAVLSGCAASAKVTIAERISMVATRISESGKEVIEPRLGPELLLEDEHPLALEHHAHLALGVVEVAELARARRACLEACGVSALARAL